MQGTGAGIKARIPRWQQGELITSQQQWVSFQWPWIWIQYKNWEVIQLKTEANLFLKCTNYESLVRTFQNLLNPMGLIKAASYGS